MGGTDLCLEGIQRLYGEIGVPGDKSISHRAALLGAISAGTTKICGFLEGADCLSTLSCLQKMGVRVENRGNAELWVHGNGLEGLREPAETLDAGNSGTTMRLLMGILAGQPFYSVITGDASLRSRPMDRVIHPLKQMGAQIQGGNRGSRAPVSVRGKRPLAPISFTTSVASAQVKSAVLLAGLYADGETMVHEPAQSRDHTERMLKVFGADVSVSDGGKSAAVHGFPKLEGRLVEVPGDISSAAFFLAAGCLVPGSEIIVRNVGTNNTRSGIIDALISMGAKLELFNRREVGGEPVADIAVRAAPLHAFTITAEAVPRLIDEIPVLAVLACFASGKTIITGAAELRVKETDRIKTMAQELSKMGAHITELEDGMCIEGTSRLHGAECSSHGDHRVAMALAVAALAAEGQTVIQGADCIQISYPGFEETLGGILR